MDTQSEYGHDDNHLLFMTWNINGWTENNKLLRMKIIEGENPDICTLIETHLKNDEEIDISGYKSYTCNRKLINKRSKRNFGGLCILIKNCIFAKYYVHVCEIDYENSIIALKLVHKATNHTFMIISGYLPPERSLWGRNASGFYNKVLQMLYEADDCNNVYFTGDFNSRVGTEKDYVTGIDEICERNAIDQVRNDHGKCLIEFLNDAKMCICNGRFKRENDNWTCIKWNGTSVVDYFIVPIEGFHYCLDFHVHTVRELVNKHKLIESEDPNVSVKIPYHSVLLLTVSTLNYTQEDIVMDARNDGKQDLDIVHTGEYNKNHIYYNRYNVKSLPGSFLGTEQNRLKLLEMINELENTRNCQDEIDDVYKKICEMYYKEMDTLLLKKNVHPYSKKRLYRSMKPFWNAELNNYWNVLCEKEKTFLKSTGRQRQVNKEMFKEA